MEAEEERERRLRELSQKILRGLVMRCHMDGAEAQEAVNDALGATKGLMAREIDLAWLAKRWGLVDLIRE